MEFWLFGVEGFGVLRFEGIGLGFGLSLRVQVPNNHILS